TTRARTLASAPLSVECSMANTLSGRDSMSQPLAPPDQHIAQYKSGAGQLVQAIAGLTPDELNAFPVPGTWSIQQIVIHMMDSDLIGSHPLQPVAAGTQPPTLRGRGEE